MRDVSGGWVIRYMALHRRIFLLHRRLSAYVPRPDLRFVQNRAGLVWFSVPLVFGIDGEAFMGYLLPWGQMSFWGAGNYHQPVLQPSRNRS